MADELPFYQQYVAVPLLLVVTLGPLATLSIGSKVADEGTLARAEAGLENYDSPDRFASYEPPEAAPGSTVIDITNDSALFTRFQRAIESTPWQASPASSTSMPSRCPSGARPPHRGRTGSPRPPSSLRS